MSPRRHDPSEHGQWPEPRRRGGLFALMRVRIELIAVVVLTTVIVGIYLLGGTTAELLLLAAVTLLTVALPEVRELLFGQVRRVVVERRLNAAFLEVPICSRSGLVPTIVRSGARRHGTRVLVWCPAGIPVERLAEDRALLAAACFVDEVIVERHLSWPNVAVVTVLRSVLDRPDPWP